MKSKVYAIYDDKAAVFLPPFFAQHEAMAVRSFKAHALEPGAVNSFPEDYSLYCIAEFDDESGYMDQVPGAGVEYPAVVFTSSALKLYIEDNKQ